MLFARRPAPALLVAAAVFVAGACGSGAGGGGGDVLTNAEGRSPASSVPSSPDTTGGTEVNGRPSSLLAFSAPAIGGGEVDAAIHQGRPVLLWFWSPW